MTIKSFTERLEAMAQDQVTGHYVTIDLSSSGLSRKLAISDTDALTILEVCQMAEVPIDNREVRLVRGGQTSVIQPANYGSTPVLHADRIAIFDKETGNVA
jgi:hypothetical protein